MFNPNKIRKRIILLISAFLLFQSAPSFARTLAQWKLLHLKEPNNPKILHYLAQGHLKQKEFREALTWYLKLGQLLPKSTVVPAETARCYWGLGYSFKAFKLCQERINTAPCNQFLKEIQEISPKLLSVLKFRFEFESKQGFKIEHAQELLKDNAHKPIFLDTMGEYFFQKNLMEFAYDFWSLAPQVFRQKRGFFEDLGKRYFKQISPNSEISTSHENRFFKAYYAYKFNPDETLRSDKLNLTDLADFFQERISQRGLNTFENYYRLGYLACLRGQKKQCQKAFEMASKKSPYRLYGFLMEETLKRLLGIQTGVELEIEGY
jgi:tetratricopeptide (TPR) repeat protein